MNRQMSLHILRFLVLFYLLFSIAPVYAVDNEVDFLQKSDEAFFMGEAQFTFYMDDFEKGKHKRSYVFDGYVKGSDRYLLVGQQPAVVRGTSHLRVDDTIYYYMKRINRTHQVSARSAFYESLFSLEDILNSKLANFYELDSWEQLQENGKAYYLLHLRAKSLQEAYGTITSQIDAVTFLPVKREYYAYSGQKIKEMVFDDFSFQKDGDLTSVSFTMHDTLIEGYYSRVCIDNIEHKAIKDNYFNRNFLKIITP